jgi:hypothetical protein
VAAAAEKTLSWLDWPITDFVWSFHFAMGEIVVG